MNGNITIVTEAKPKSKPMTCRHDRNMLCPRPSEDCDTCQVHIEYALRQAERMEEGWRELNSGNYWDGRD